MRRIIIPPFCSVFSAFGAVASDVRHDYVETVALPQAKATPAALQAVFARLAAQARAQLAAEHVPPARMVIEWSADLRYEGQSYELNLPVANTAGKVAEADIAATIRQFHELHWRIYAYGEPNEPVEFISLRVAGIGRVPQVQLPTRRASSGRAQPKGERPVYFPALDGFITTRVYERDTLRPGQRVAGPCLIEEATSTTVIAPGCAGTVDAYGNLIVLVGAARPRPARKRARAAGNGHQPRTARVVAGLKG